DVCSSDLASPSTCLYKLGTATLKCLATLARVSSANPSSSLRRAASCTTNCGVSLAPGIGADFIEQLLQDRSNHVGSLRLCVVSALGNHHNGPVDDGGNPFRLGLGVLPVGVFLTHDDHGPGSESLGGGNGCSWRGDGPYDRAIPVGRTQHPEDTFFLLPVSFWGTARVECVVEESECPGAPGTEEQDPKGQALENARGRWTEGGAEQGGTRDQVGSADRGEGGCRRTQVVTDHDHVLTAQLFGQGDHVGRRIPVCLRFEGGVAVSVPAQVHRGNPVACFRECGTDETERGPVVEHARDTDHKS